LAAVAARPSGSPAGGAVYGFAVLPNLGKTAPKSSNPWKNPSQIFQGLETFLPMLGKSRGAGSACFQGLEKQPPFFPMLGKRSRKISKVWKTDAHFFQASENRRSKHSNPRKETFDFFQALDGKAGFFPKSGKKSSDPWNAARARGPGRGPALRGAVKDVSTEWNVDSISVSPETQSREADAKRRQ